MQPTAKVFFFAFSKPLMIFCTVFKVYFFQVGSAQDLETYGTRFVLNSFLFSRKCLSKTSKNVSSNLVQLSIFSFLRTSFNSLLNFKKKLFIVSVSNFF